MTRLGYRPKGEEEDPLELSTIMHTIINSYHLKMGWYLTAMIKTDGRARRRLLRDASLALQVKEERYLKDLFTRLLEDKDASQNTQKG